MESQPNNVLQFPGAYAPEGVVIQPSRSPHELHYESKSEVGWHSPALSTFYDRKIFSATQPEGQIFDFEQDDSYEWKLNIAK